MLLARWGGAGPPFSRAPVPATTDRLLEGSAKFGAVSATTKGPTPARRRLGASVLLRPAQDWEMGWTLRRLPFRVDIARVTIWKLVERREAWISELETSVLDYSEYIGMLGHRTLLEEELAITGVRAAFDAVDDLDFRFREITEEAPPGADAYFAGKGWWWSRLPADPERRHYLFMDLETW